MTVPLPTSRPRGSDFRELSMRFCEELDLVKEEADPSRRSPRACDRVRDDVVGGKSV